MKKLTLLLSAVFATLIVVANPNIKAIKSGDWNNNTNWDLNRQPANGDTITIPAGITIDLKNDKTFTSDVYLYIAGTLNFVNNSTTLALTSNSVIRLAGGTLQGNGSPSEKLKMGNKAVFGGDQVYSGFFMATAFTPGLVSTSGAVLPVVFSSFSVATDNNSVLVQWTTASEQGADYFEVQRSTNGTNWEKAGVVKAIGNTARSTAYRFSDRATSNAVYYRIRQVDANGYQQFTAVKKLMTQANISLATQGNNLVLQLPGTTQPVVVSIVNYNGQVVSRQQVSGAGQVVVAAGVKGQYVVSVSNGADLQWSRSVLL